MTNEKKTTGDETSVVTERKGFFGMRLLSSPTEFVVVQSWRNGKGTYDALYHYSSKGFTSGVPEPKGTKEEVHEVLPCGKIGRKLKLVKKN